MSATLSGPLVTDYIPAGKNPWLLLALIAGVIVVGVPSQHILAALLMLGAVAALVCAVSARAGKPLPPEENPDALAADDDPEARTFVHHSGA